MFFNTTKISTRCSQFICALDDNGISSAALERKSYIIVLLTCSRPMYFINHLWIINRLMFIKYILTEKLICNDVATNMMQIATMFIQNDFLGN